MLDELSTTAQRLLEEADHDVAWVEKPEGAASGRRALVVAPLSVAGTLATNLYDERTVVATSATLALGGEFRPWPGHWGLTGPPNPPAPSQPPPPGQLRPQPPVDQSDRSRIGRAPQQVLVAGTGGDGAAGPGWRSMDVGSPFDYARQGILYVAAHLPRPSASGLPTPAGEELLTLVGGARRAYPRSLLFPAGRGAGRGAGPGPHRTARAAPGRGGVTAAGPPVPGRAVELPVRGDVALAGGGRARRRLPARGDRPAALPPPR